MYLLGSAPSTLRILSRLLFPARDFTLRKPCHTRQFLRGIVNFQFPALLHQALARPFRCLSFPVFALTGCCWRSPRGWPWHQGQRSGRVFARGFGARWPCNPFGFKPGSHMGAGLLPLGVQPLGERCRGHPKKRLSHISPSCETANCQRQCCEPPGGPNMDERHTPAPQTQPCRLAPSVLFQRCIPARPLDMQPPALRKARCIQKAALVCH